jgi:hypothetical protein
MTRTAGEFLFKDRFDGASVEGWRVTPVSLEDDPEQGRALHLRAGDPNAGLWLGWAGDDSWRNYRVEMEILPVGEGTGFLGFDFHARDDESGCCNLHFQAFPEGGERLFEGCARYDDGNTSWKLGPLSQKAAPAVPGEWIRLRLDAGETVANLYVDGAPEPVFTVFDLPFSRGGVRLWRYYASALFRNLRVTALGGVEPILEDVWGSVLGPGVIRNWEVSRMLPREFAADGLEDLGAADMAWREAYVDRRGVVNVVGLDASEYCRKGVVLARASVGSESGSTRAFRTTYTDRMSVWCNGVKVFDGEARGWNDPGRSEADGWGRLMPDQFEFAAELRPGSNDVLVRLEVNEPIFGSGFWMRSI